MVYAYTRISTIYYSKLIMNVDSEKNRLIITYNSLVNRHQPLKNPNLSKQISMDKFQWFTKNMIENKIKKKKQRLRP